ncbi:MAG: restriction endonuclease subunit S [Candidatus Nomurabacteria bacterium]
MKTNRPQKNNSGTWQTIPVGDVFTFVKSYAFSRDNLSNGILSSDKIGNIHYGDIHATFTSENIDLSKVQIPIVKDVAFSPKKEDLLKDGDLIMADASEDYDGIGVTISVHGIGKNKVVGGLHTFVLRDEKGLTTEYYRQYIFLNKEIRNKLQKVANGVSVYGISKTALAKMELPLPSLSEQNRIVSVLETWDKSIENLEEKIEIKKHIKKALVSDLLTGKKRLGGFSDKWETVELGNICEIKRGGSPRPIQNYITEEKDGLNWLRIGDVPIGDRYIYKTSEKIRKEGLNKTTLVKEGDFILSNSMSFGRPYIMKTEACIHDGWLALMNVSASINKDFLYYLLSSPKTQSVFRSISAGSGVLNLKKETVSEVVIKIPKLKEQVLIANILTTTDNEIDSLEKKLSILKEQKRYILCNLITGKIRTPETLSTKLTK